MDKREPVLSRFGETIRKLRKAKSMSLRMLAAQVEISPTYLSKIERGQLPAPIDDKIFRFAELLDQDADVLLALAGRIANDVQQAILQHPEEMASLVLAAAELPPVEIKRLAREATERKPKKRRSKLK